MRACIRARRLLVRILARDCISYGLTMAAKLRPRVMLPRFVLSKAARAAKSRALSFSGLLNGSYRRPDVIATMLTTVRVASAHKAASR